MVGAISLINLGVMYFEVGIGPILGRAVETYTSIVHVGFDYLLFWMDWKMPAWLKDVVTLYLVFGSATIRGQFLFGYEQRTHGPVFTFFLWPWWLVESWKNMRDFGSMARQGFLQVDDETDLGPVLSAIHKENLLIIILNMVLVPVAASIAILIESGL